MSHKKLAKAHNVGKKEEETLVITMTKHLRKNVIEDKRTEVTVGTRRLMPEIPNLLRASERKY